VHFIDNDGSWTRNKDSGSDYDGYNNDDDSNYDHSDDSNYDVFDVSEYVFGFREWLHVESSEPVSKSKHNIWFEALIQLAHQQMIPETDVSKYVFGLGSGSMQNHPNLCPSRNTVFGLRLGFKSLISK
jgi:hypothetical protein